MRRAFAAIAAAAILELATGTAASAATTDFFYPNMTQDVTHASPDCSQFPLAPCSLRDAMSLADQDNNDADVFLASGTTYALTPGSYVLTATPAGGKAQSVRFRILG